MLRRTLVSCAVGLLSALTALGADYSGIWSGQITDRNGDLLDLSFQFTQKGSTLSGKMYGDNESTPIVDGGISANEITFSVSSELNGQITKFIYTGTIHGDEIDVTRERSAPKNNTAGGNAAAGKKGNQKQTFRLKRLA